MGKLDLLNLKNIIDRNRDIIVETNIIGSDFSTIGKNIIVKIEPMMYYKFFTPEENARLSYVFAENDFITSGVDPQYALIDFESPYGEWKNYLLFIDEIYRILREKKVRMASAHTGEYANIGEGVCGSIALISMESPLFGPQKLTKGSIFYLMGQIGKEYIYFSEMMSKKKSQISVEDLSIRNIIEKIREFPGKIEFVHDLAEGGLVRAMNELSYLAGTGLKISYEDAVSIIPEGLRQLGDNVFSMSSSGAALISVPPEYSNEFSEFAGQNVVKIRRVKNGVWIGEKKMNIVEDGLSKLINKSLLNKLNKS